MPGLDDYLKTVLGSSWTPAQIQGLEAFLEPASSSDLATLTAEERSAITLAYQALVKTRPLNHGQEPHYQKLMAQLRAKIPEPPMEVVEAYLQEELGEDPTLSLSLDGLSRLSKKGLYLLLVHDKIPSDNLQKFLRHSAGWELGRANNILETVALLYDQGVEGYAGAFFPAGRDEKFLSEDESRIASLLFELQQGLWLKHNTDATRVVLGAQVAVDWKLLSPEQSAYVDKLTPELPWDLRTTFRAQTQTEVDALVYSPSHHGPRLVEIKRRERGNFNPVGEERAKILLQVIRHGLVVQQQVFAGIEYVIEAAGIETEFLRLLIEAFELTGVRYLIRLQGGLKKEIIQNETGEKLTYSVTEMDLPKDLQTKRLPSPPLRKAPGTAERKSGTKGKSDDLPWSKEIKNWLAKFILPSLLNIKKLKTVDDFIGGAKAVLGLPEQRAIGTAITGWLDGEFVGEQEVEDQIREALEGFRQEKHDLGNEQIRCLVRVAALATGELLPEEEEEADPAESFGLTRDLEQKLALGKEWTIQPLIAGILQQGKDALVTIESMIDSTVGPVSWPDYSNLQDCIQELAPESVAVFENLTLTQMPKVMELTQATIAWKAGLAQEIQHYIDAYDKTLALCSSLRPPAPAPKPLDQVFAPIPKDTLQALIDYVYSLGALPERIKKPATAVAAKPVGPKIFIYDEEHLKSLYRTLIIFRLEGDESHGFYYPQELHNLDLIARAYLKKCGWDEKRMDIELRPLRGAILQGLFPAYAELKSLDDIIPKNFQRTDLITAIDPFSGAKWDVTKMVERIWRLGNQRELQDLIRVVVTNGGRKIYFVNWDGLVGLNPGQLFQVPTYDELMKILAQSDKLEDFFKALLRFRGQEVEIPETLTLYGRKISMGVPGLNLKSGAVKRSKSHFALVFTRHEGSYFINSLRGMGALELGLSFVDPESSPLHQAILASLWDIPNQSKNKDAKLGWNSLVSSLSSGSAVIEELWSLLCRANPRLDENPETLTLYGLKLRADVSGLKLEAGAVKESSQKFALVFTRHEGKYFISALKGSGALELGLSYVGPVPSPLHQVILASLWGGIRRSKNENDKLDWNSLVSGLSAGSAVIAELWSLLCRANPRLDENPETLTLYGVKETGGVIGFNLEAGTVGKSAHYFALVFTRHEGSYFISSLEGRAALELGLSYVGPVSSLLHQAILASLWGIRNKSKDGAAKLSWNSLVSSLSGGSAVIAELWSLLCRTNPRLDENPETLTLYGLKETAGVVGLNLEAGTVEKSVSYFDLVFTRHEGSYFIKSLHRTAALELGLSYVGSVSNLLHQAILASLWNIPNTSKNEDAKLGWNSLVSGLSKGSPMISELWSLLCRANPRLDESPETLTLYGFKKSADVSGLSLKAGAVETPRGYFTLVFTRHGTAYTLDSAKGTGAKELEKVFLSGHSPEIVDHGSSSSTSGGRGPEPEGDLSSKKIVPALQESKQFFGDERALRRSGAERVIKKNVPLTGTVARIINPAQLVQKPLLSERALSRAVSPIKIGAEKSLHHRALPLRIVGPKGVTFRLGRGHPFFRPGTIK